MLSSIFICFVCFVLETDHHILLTISRTLCRYSPTAVPQTLQLAMINMASGLLAVACYHLAYIRGSAVSIATNKPNSVTTSLIISPTLKRIINTRLNDAVTPFISAFSNGVKLWELCNPSLQLFCKYKTF